MGNFSGHSRIPKVVLVVHPSIHPFSSSTFYSTLSGHHCCSFSSHHRTTTFHRDSLCHCHITLPLSACRELGTPKLNTGCVDQLAPTPPLTNYSPPVSVSRIWESNSCLPFVFKQTVLFRSLPLLPSSPQPKASLSVAAQRLHHSYSLHGRSQPQRPFESFDN